MKISSYKIVIVQVAQKDYEQIRKAFGLEAIGLYYQNFLIGVDVLSERLLAGTPFKTRKMIAGLICVIEADYADADSVRFEW